MDFVGELREKKRKNFKEEREEVGKRQISHLVCENIL